VFSFSVVETTTPTMMHRRHHRLSAALLFTALLASAVASAVGPVPDRKTMSEEEFTAARRRHDAFHDGVYHACASRCAADGCARTAAIFDPTEYSPTIAIDGECHARAGGNGVDGPDCELPWHLRVTQWTCDEDCGYRCMRGLEVARASVGFPPAKFSGKWNFKRVAVGLY
jgi:hypothetical protein